MLVGQLGMDGCGAAEDLASDDGVVDGCALPGGPTTRTGSDAAAAAIALSTTSRVARAAPTMRSPRRRPAGRSIAGTGSVLIASRCTPNSLMARSLRNDHCR
jgi:hypothetical protein